MSEDYKKLRAALKKGSPESLAKFKQLLADGANPNVENHRGETILLMAVGDSHFEFAVPLLLKAKNKADPNAATPDGWTPLMQAAHDGKGNVVKWLLDADAKVNTAKGYGWTALMSAAFEGHDKVVDILLKRGANPNAALNADWTALFSAYEAGHSKVVEILEKKAKK